MRMKLVSIAAALALFGLSSPSYALNFMFSFTDTDPAGGPNCTNCNVPGTVTGEIFGLTEGTSAAVDLQIFSTPDYPVGGPPAFDAFAGGNWFSPIANTFTVSSGVITSWTFEANGVGSGGTWRFDLISTDSLFGPLNHMFFSSSIPDPQSPDFVQYETASPSIEFTPVDGQTPIPAALPLFATGLGAMGLFGWRRKRKAPPAAA